MIVETWNRSYWHVVYTKPNSEKRLTEYLTEQGIKVYLPVIKKHSQWSDRRKILMSPLFRNYVFVKINTPLDKEIVYQSRGFLKFVCTNGKADVITEDEINLIRTIVSSSQEIEIGQYKNGEEVKVIRGPLCGLRGKHIRSNGKTKLQIYLTGVKQTLVVELSMYDVVSAKL